MPTAHEKLSEQFHKWELRGRGWQMFDELVYLEPPFVPFTVNYFPETPPVDTGVRPSFFGSLVRGVGQKLSAQPPPPQIEPEPEEEPEPTPFIREPLTELQVSLPAELDCAKDSLEQFFSSLSLCKEPLAFELLGVHKRVTVQFAAASNDVPLVRRQLQAFFPAAQYKTCKDALARTWVTCSGEEELVVEFGLAREFMYLLASGKRDPFVGIIGALSELQADEIGLFQILWQPVREDWPENIMRSVTHEDGKPFFVDTPELTSAAETKISKPLFAAVIRIATKAKTFDRALQIASDMAGSLRTFASPQGNHLIPLKNEIETYPIDEHVVDLLFRQSRRSGMILNSEELTGFVHLPSDEVQSPVLTRNSGTTKAAPEVVRQTQGFVIGDNEHLGESVPVHLTADQRVRHTHIIGSSGSGKSSLLFNMIRQDIENGEGVAVLDPHGDLIDQLLSIIPDNRIEDVVLVDVSDAEFPVSFNILQAHSEEEKILLASDLIAVFRRLSSSWGDQMDAVMQNAILAFLNSTRGGTLKDLQRFLLDKPPFRKEFLQTVQDTEVVEFWTNVFPQLSGGKSIPSVLTRLQDFFARKTLRNMVSQPKNKLDFADIMDSGKIFLANLSEGLCGEENSYLLGTLLVSKFQQLAMARQSQDASKRRQFWLYIDEFDHFITPSMAKILSGARKYRLGLTLAHQQLHQLQSDSKVASAVMTQPCTRIVFHVEDEDAKRLGDSFESFEAKHLKTLEKYHAIVRVERNDFDFNLAVRKPELPDAAAADVQREKAVAASRAKYATPRAEVETALLANINKPPLPPDAPPSSPPLKPPTPPTPPAPTVEKAQPTPASELPKVAELPKAAEPVPTIEPPPPVKRESPKDLGRGHADHKNLQKQLQEEARALGFLAEIEKQLKSSSMQAADLRLERDGVTVAVEMSFTTGPGHELENVEKCLARGFSKIIVLCDEAEKLSKMAEFIQPRLAPKDAAKVIYCVPESFGSELQKIIAQYKLTPKPPTPDEETILGYKVKRSKPTLTPEEEKQRESLAHRVINEILLRPA